MADIIRIPVSDEYRNRSYYSLPDGTTVTGIQEDGSAAICRQKKPINRYPVSVRPNSDRNSLTVEGVTIVTDDPLIHTWEERYNDPNSSSNYNHASLAVRGGEMFIKDIRTDNGWDSLRIGAYDNPDRCHFTIEKAWLTNNRDDAIEDDGKRSGILRDSLIDGCYRFFSAKSSNSTGPDQLVTVENCLVRMNRQPGPRLYNEKDNRGVPVLTGHGGIWKWDDDGPDLIVKDSIFYIEWIPITRGGESAWIRNAASGLDFLIGQGKLREASNVVIVWPPEAEERWGSYQSLCPNVGNHPAFTITDDVSVFTEARRSWCARYTGPRFPDDDFTMVLDQTRVPMKERIDTEAVEPPPEPQPPTEPPVYQLMLSKVCQRTDAQVLDGQSVSGDIFVFTMPEEGVNRVDFEIPELGYTQREGKAPFDLAGGPMDCAAAFNVDDLDDGVYTVHATIRDGSGDTRISGTFVIAEDVVEPPEPPEEDGIYKIQVTDPDGNVRTYEAREVTED